MLPSVAPLVEDFKQIADAIESFHDTEHERIQERLKDTDLPLNLDTIRAHCIRNCILNLVQEQVEGMSEYTRALLRRIVNGIKA